MNQLVFATHNPNKVEEIRDILTDFEIQSLRDINYDQEILETGATLFENALIKVRAVYKATGKACMADDTGLEVFALGGAPGVHSARYAGEKATSDDNIDKLLHQLEGVEDRKASFRTVIAFMNTEGQYRFFEGEVKGEILRERKGSSGFGYDPVFKPLGYEKSFAEMPAAEKNQISHRGRAIAELVEYLKLTSDYAAL